MERFTAAALATILASLLEEVKCFSILVRVRLAMLSAKESPPLLDSMCATWVLLAASWRDFRALIGKHYVGDEREQYMFPLVGDFVKHSGG